jgi:hypothetical protein
VILKMLEAPIRNMGMNSPHLLKLIEDFPAGSETLVLRIIHILTEKCKLILGNIFNSSNINYDSTHF